MITILFSVIHIHAGAVLSVVTYAVGMKSDRVMTVTSGKL